MGLRGLEPLTSALSVQLSYSLDMLVTSDSRAERTLEHGLVTHT